MLTIAQFAQVTTILERIDRGLPCPRMPGRVGRFLRQYAAAGNTLAHVFADSEISRRANGSVSGNGLGTIEIHPIGEPEIAILNPVLGEVARTLAFSEELGGLIQLTMWLKARIANTAYNMLQTGNGLRFTGDYRWTPPNKLTPGEAEVQISRASVKWHDAPSLNAVADDLSREPHALEYVVDRRFGHPGVKYFRCICALRQARQWLVLPALKHSITLDVVAAAKGAVPYPKAGDLACLLVFREPWSSTWFVVDAVPIDFAGALRHSIAWVDFQQELRGVQFDARIINSIRTSLKTAGIGGTTDVHGSGTRRRLRPVARRVLRALRGLH